MIDTVPGLINIPKIIFYLDAEFAREIKEAKRATGLYQMKSYGFEYRSLPATIDILEVADFLEKEKIWL